MSQAQSALGRHGETMLVEGAVYEFHKPSAPNRIGVEIVFMHGLQPGDFKNAYWKTWLTRTGSKAIPWIKTWLGNDYPNARILSLCYDTSVWQTPTTGNMDPGQLSNNILQNMVMPNAKIGQSDSPVIFVCHSLGGLMAKEILMMAADSEDGMVKKLFSNMKGLFFFATPHLGSMLAGSCMVGCAKFLCSMSPMVEYLEVLNKRSSTLNQEFLTKFAHKFGREWMVYVAAEGSMTTRFMIFKAWVVEASSANLVGSKVIQVDGANHAAVCKPTSKEDQGYQHLKKCINEVIANHDNQHANRLVEVPLDLFGIDDNRLEPINEKLKKASIVGLVGMGGLGKTTISKVYYNSKLVQYEKSAYLENVASRAMKDVQLQLYEDLFPYMNSKDATEDERLAQIRECLTTKEVLVVVDDVDALKHTLQELQIEDSQNEKIKVIVTCRDQGVLNEYEADDPKFAVSIVEVDGIKDNDNSDWKFFCHHAFCGIDDQELKNSFDKVARDIVDQCQGLPLALEVIGKYLKEVNRRTNISELDRKEMWKEALDRLQKAQSLRGGDNDKLWSCLQISFDKLFEDIEQEIFLAFACVFCEVPELKKRSIGEIWNSPNGIEHLIQRSLLKERHDGCLSIHNQLRDMGRRIVQERAERDILKQAHVWKRKEILKFLRTNESSTTLTGLSLVGESKDEEDEEDEDEEVELVHNTMFDLSCTAKDAMIRNASEGYSELKLLHLFRLNKPHVVDSCLFKCSVEKLLWLRLDDSMITIDGLQRIWSLKGLRVLQIIDCNQLEEIPESLGDLIHLVELEIVGCDGVNSLPDDIGKLRQLRRLKLDECLNLLAIPTGVGQLPKLEYLSLKSCRSLKSLCDFESSMSSLRELYIEDNNNLKTITGLSNMHNLQILSLSACFGLGNCDLSGSLGKLSKLEQLDLLKCWGLVQEVADALRNEQLHTDRLTKLKLPIFLEACLPHCPKLTDLFLQNGLGSNKLPSELFNVMPKLEELVLSEGIDNSGFKDLPGSLWNLRTLESLFLFGFGELRELNPEGIKNLSQLQTLYMSSCKSLERLPVSLGDLPQFCYLCLRDCGKLQWEEESQRFLREKLISRGCTLEIYPPPDG